MELTMTMGTFEALDQQELFAVEGGHPEDYTFGQMVGYALKMVYSAWDRACESIAAKLAKIF
nr:hypothetical protein [Clostridia bacterium]